VARWKWVVGGIALIALVVALWQFPTWLKLAETGAAYGARVGCSCRFIQGRDIASCESDFEPGMELVSLADVEPDDGAQPSAVTASVPLLASRTARYAGTSGCILDPE
jgi:hypothetical protein